MTSRFSSGLRPLRLAVMFGILGAFALPSEAQIDAGLLATGRDREITVNYDASQNKTDVRLTIVLAGSGAASGVTLVFNAQFPGTTVGTVEPVLTARTHITARSVPAQRDPRTGTEGREMVFQIDPHTKSGITLYLYASNYGYSGFVAPGDEIQVAYYTMTAAELRALAKASTMTGRALGSDFTLAPDQLAAIAEFAKRVIR